MAARHLKAENHGFFNTAELKFEKIVQVRDGLRVKEEQELHQVRPARKRLEEIEKKGVDAQRGMPQAC